MNISRVFGEKIEHHTYADRHGIYGVAVNEEGLYGIIKTPRGYFLPGGGLEAGESHEDALYREFIEETGLKIQVNQYVVSSLLHDLAPSDGKYYNMYAHLYQVSIIERVQKQIEEDHHLVWVSHPEELLKLSHQKHVITIYKEAYNGR